MRERRPRLCGRNRPGIARGLNNLDNYKPGDRIRRRLSRRTRPYTMNVVRDDQIDMKSLELVTTSSAEALTTLAGVPDYPLIYRSLRKRPDVAGRRKKSSQPGHSASAGSGPSSAWALA